jgi:hypothetical protein
VGYENLKLSLKISPNTTADEVKKAIINYYTCHTSPFKQSDLFVVLVSHQRITGDFSHAFEGIMSLEERIIQSWGFTDETRVGIKFQTDTDTLKLESDLRDHREMLNRKITIVGDEAIERLYKILESCKGNGCEISVLKKPLEMSSIIEKGSKLSTINEDEDEDEDEVRPIRISVELFDQIFKTIENGSIVGGNRICIDFPISVVVRPSVVRE